jgi:hypothetical protein
MSRPDIGKGVSCSIIKKDQAVSTSGKEACLSCGEETAAGSVFYSDRRVIDREDGSRTYLCSLCAERLAASRHQKRLSDDEIRRLTNNWSAAVNAFTGGH